MLRSNPYKRMLYFWLHFQLWRLVTRPTCNIVSNGFLFCNPRKLYFHFWSVITSPTNWYLYQWVSWNISEVINENSTSAWILIIWTTLSEKEFSPPQYLYSQLGNGKWSIFSLDFIAGFKYWKVSGGCHLTGSNFSCPNSRTEYHFALIDTVKMNCKYLFSVSKFIVCALRFDTVEIDLWAMCHAFLFHHWGWLWRIMLV